MTKVSTALSQAGKLDMTPRERLIHDGLRSTANAAFDRYERHQADERAIATAIQAMKSAGELRAVVAYRMETGR